MSLRDTLYDMEIPRPRDSAQLSDASREKMFAELFSISDKQATTKAAVNPPLVVSEGQVARMSLPSSWQNGRELHNVRGNSSYHELNPAGDKETKLYLFDRGFPMTDGAAKAFHDVMSKPPHDLNASEVASLRELLRGKGDSTVFQFNQAKTENLNGRRILCIEGLYKEDQIGMRAIFIPANDSGSMVQEIEYQAPKAKYNSHLNDANQAFKSIIWK